MNNNNNNNTDNNMKTKWQKLMESPKGYVQYNPNQSFALHVYWVVRSPTAAKEMMQLGFHPCSESTQQNTPTTLAYFFRIARDQSLAQELKNEIKTIGQHPHYQSAFKSIQMGIPQTAIEMKLKNGGIPVEPLSCYSPDEPLLGHEQELDFDPIVLECTEVYLDSRSFYEHGCSPDWMKSSAELWKAVRSLKPTTYCLGNPSDQVWNSVLEPSLKAIRFNKNDNVDTEIVNCLQPGLFLPSPQQQQQLQPQQLTNHVFMELDLIMDKEKITMCREYISRIEQELQAQYLIVIPTRITDGTIHVRVMISFNLMNSNNSLHLLRDGCNDQMEGQVFLFSSETIVEPFLRDSKVNDKILIVDGEKSRSDHLLAGYILHPLYNELIADESIDYQV